MKSPDKVCWWYRHHESWTLGETLLFWCVFWYRSLGPWVSAISNTRNINLRITTSQSFGAQCDGAGVTLGQIVLVSLRDSSRLFIQFLCLANASKHQTWEGKHRSPQEIFGRPDFSLQKGELLVWENLRKRFTSISHEPPKTYMFFEVFKW